MTKQELIESIKKRIEYFNGVFLKIKYAEIYNAQAVSLELLYFKRQAEQLDEPPTCRFDVVEHNEYVSDYICSNCGKSYHAMTVNVANYCPSCGRKVER